MSVATRKVKVKKYGHLGRPYWVTERVAVRHPPPIKSVGCDDFFDPITKKKLPGGVNELLERLNEIIDYPANDNRYFDPCTKRLLPNLVALRHRVDEIACFYANPTWMQYFNDSTVDNNKLSLQLHQEIIVEGICRQYRKENPNIDYDTNITTYPYDRDNRYLIGVLPRGGKTYIAGGIMLSSHCFSISSNHTILWITAAPNETRLQVQKELIGKFSQFERYAFVDVKSGENYQKSTGDTTGTIYFVSSQLLSLHSTGHVRDRSILNEIFAVGKIDLIFFDEAHKTGSGATTREQLEKIIQFNPKSPVIFLTATYYTVQKEYGIPKEKTFLWDYTDVLAARNLGSRDEIVQSKAYEALTSRFESGLVDEVLRRRRCKKESFESMSKSYSEYPDLHFLSADFNPQALHHFEEAGIFTEEDGFDMGKLLKIKDTATITQFKTKSGKILANAFEQFEDIDLVSDFIELLGAFILPRIDAISKQSGSRFNLSENPSLMMFMPSGRKGTNIFFTLVAWGTALMGADWWNERYEVVCVVENETMPKDLVGVNNTTVTTQSSMHVVSKNVKETILDLEQKARSKGKGLIILAGEKLSMGVSLPFVDVVMMLNDKFSPDDIIQKMYRAVTPDSGKKTAFIVDFTPERTLTAIYGYTKAASPASLSAQKVLEILLNTYYWDADIIPRNMTGREQLLAHRNTFQASLRKLFNNAVGNAGAKKAALEAEIDRMHKHFLGKERKLREKLSLNYKNLTHPNNRAVLDPMRNMVLQKQEAIKALQTSMLTSPTPGKASELRALLNNFKTYSKTFANTIVETRKRRKALNSAETKKVKLTVMTAAKAEKERLKAEAAAAKAAAKERLKAEAAAAKAAEKAALLAEKERLKAEAAAAKAAAKAALLAEKDRLKAEAAAAKAAATATRRAAKAAGTGTRKRAKATPAAPPANNHTGNTTEEEN